MAEQQLSIDALARELRSEGTLSHELNLRVGDWRVRIETNSDELVRRLQHYFRYFPRDEGAPDDTICAIECAPVCFDVEFRDWPRDGGKRGRKDEYADVPGGRIVRKVRTDMQFLIGRTEKLAVGPCLQNDSQVINFINALYMNRMLRRGYVLCHASGVTRDDRGLALAAVSGAGKSTLALLLLSRGFSFVSNDRVLVQKASAGAWMSGVPKLPRINPGTALGNPNLADLLPEVRREQLQALGTDERWDLEEKYDVFIDRHFPGSRFELRAPLDALIVLAWSRRSDEPARCSRVDLAIRPDLLSLIAESAGPFYSPVDGGPNDKGRVELQRYVDTLADVPIYEIRGRVDFERACTMAAEILDQSRSAPDGAATS